MKDQIYKIALTKIPKVGNKIGFRLLQHFGSAKSVFGASKKELIEIFGIGDQRVDHIKSDVALKKAEKEVKYLSESGAKAYFLMDEDYPRRLKQIADPPLMIYLKGDVNIDAEKVIAVVGTRKPSPYGIAKCEQFLEDLVDYKPLIISGLAFGIDYSAHFKALQLGFPTIGVVAHGLPEIYPAQHRSLAEKMSKQGGILTEFTHNIVAEREFFAMRNRIIAGLCDALVVVQTAVKGGSMISANLANSYFKDVYAFPGRAGDHRSAGCNLLIKTNKAQLIESGSDLAFNLGWDQPMPIAIQTKLFETLDDKEQMVVEYLREKQEAGIDELSIQCKLTNSEISSVLLQLEFKGLLHVGPGKIFTLAH